MRRPRLDLRLDLFCFTLDSFPGRMADRRLGWDPSPRALLLELLWANKNEHPLMH